MQIDILAFGAHPDDVELSASGIILHQIKLGYSVGIIDLTRGELGTRGTPEIREQEAQKAAAILGVQARENLGLKDGFFANEEANQIEVVKIIRKYKPEIIIAGAKADRHPDHGRGGALVADAAFLSGLQKIETTLEGEPQEAWRPEVIYHYVQYHHYRPDFVVDVTPYMEKKIASIKAYSSQFHDPNNTDEPETIISTDHFFESIYARARDFGREIQVPFAEGFLVNRAIGVKDLFDLR